LAALSYCETRSTKTKAANPARMLAALFIVLQRRLIGRRGGATCCQIQTDAPAGAGSRLRSKFRHVDAGLARAVRFRYAWRKAWSERAMRILMVISFLLCLHPAQASMLGCEQKTADPLYCQNGARRPICSQGGYLVWADTRVAVSSGELAFLASDGPVPRPACAAIPAK
jgi:hypothetical protein